MKSNKYFLVLLAVMAAACSKKKDDVVIEQPKPTETLLQSYTVFYADTEMNIDYDTDNSILNIQFLDVVALTAADSPITYFNNGKVNTFGICSYTYNSSGKLSLLDNSNVDGNATIEYNTEGQPIRKYVLLSLPEGILTEETILEYLDNKLHLISIKIEEDITGYLQFELSYDPEGNLGKTIYRKSDDGATYEDIEETVYTYDDKLNPWHQIFIDKLNMSEFFFSGNYLGDITTWNSTEMYSLFYVSPNNLVKTTSTSLIPGHPRVITSTYTPTYNEKDLPVEVQLDRIYSDNGPDAPLTRYYTYVEKQKP